MVRLLRVILCGFTLLYTTPQFFAQETAKQSAFEQIDSFRAVACDDLMARLDYYAYQLEHKPGTNGYVVYYAERHGLQGKLDSYLAYIKPYLIVVHGISPDRIVMLDGGERDALTFELWAGTERPSLRKNSADGKAAFGLTSRKYDEGFADYLVDQGQRELWTYDLCPVEAVNLKGFANELRAEPGKKGLVVVYSERGQRARRAWIVAGLMKKELISYGVASRRIITRYGGVQKIPFAELWITPENVR